MLCSINDEIASLIRAIVLNQTERVPMPESLHNILPKHSRITLNTVFVMTLGLIAAGCGGDPEAKYIPDSSAARSALELVLNAWKDGKPFGPNKLNDIPVETFDARWRDGGKLESFEILSEESLEGRPTFKVRVQIQKSQAIEDTFVVIGNNPLMVFRKQDFDKAGGN